MSIFKKFVFSVALLALPAGFAGAFDRGIVSITVDDGWSTSYKSLQAGVFGNYKTTQYIYSDAMNQVHGDVYVDSSAVQSMFADGHEIGAHSRTHSDLTATTSAGVIWEVQGSLEDLEAVVGEGNVTSFAYPFGASNSTVENIVDDYFDSARFASPGFNADLSNNYELLIQRVTDSTTIEDFEDWINEATSNKSWLILMFHEIVEDVPTGCDSIEEGDEEAECTTREVVEGMTSYLQANNVCVLTVSEVLAGEECEAAPLTHIIEATAEANGSIDPDGNVGVEEGANQTFTITPDSGYRVATLTVDGNSIATSTSYTFENVAAAHTIAVTFELQPGVEEPEECPEGQVGTPPNCEEEEPVDVCPDVEGTQTSTDECTEVEPEEPENDNGRSDRSNRSSRSRSGGGVVYCTSERTEFCRDREGSVLGASTGFSFSSTQVASLIAVLQSFGNIDDKTIEIIKNILNGQ